MLAALAVLVVAAIAVVVMAVGHVDGGYALLGWGDWTVETSLVVLILCVIVALALAWGLLRLFGGTLRLPGRMRRGFRERRERRARRSLETGLLDLLQGRWKEAETELIRRASDSPVGWLHYLGAARAAQRLGAAERREHYLGLATEQADGPELRGAVLAAGAQLQRERGDFAALERSARALHAERGEQPDTREILAAALAGEGRWAELQKLLAEPASADLPPALHQELQYQALQARIDAALAAGRSDELHQAWVDAGEPAEQPALRLAYAEGLVHLGREEEAQAFITPILDAGWDAQLARAYGRLQATDPATRLAHVETWLQRHGEHPELLAAAGRACLQAHLWGKAGSYLEPLLKDAPSPQAYWDLAQWAEATGHPQDAARYCRKGLMAAVTEPDAAPKAARESGASASA
ncbi:MAG TPA: heme biosynthesis HemY N-terminal domain-containing protein [Nevskiaceae bacterium]